MDLNFKRNPARLKSLHRQSEQNRPVRETQPIDDKADAFLNAVLFGLGSQLTELDSQMREPCPELDTAKRIV
jgi:hypothetical protein